MDRMKKNDVALVIAGVDSGKTGKVLRVLPKSGRIVLEGVNMTFKHVRRSQQNPQGGRIQKESPIDISNVLPYCEKCEAGVKVRFEVKDGVKRRVCRKCSAAFTA